MFPACDQPHRTSPGHEMTDFQIRTDGGEMPPIVLVVEDDRDTRDMYEALLKAEGFWVMKVADAAEAFEYAVDFHPDAVLTDLGLPGDADGPALIQHLRAEPDLEFTPVVAVTSRQPPELPSLRGLGIAAVLLKPVSPGALIEGIKSAMQESAVLRARSQALLERIPVLLQRSHAGLKRSAAVSSARRQRACPGCSRPLVWALGRELPQGRYDYYHPCKQGCGLFGFNVSTREFQPLAPRERSQEQTDASPGED
jgi:CheY-like chemotaxis protein